jgi:hypothetical protein
MAAGFRHDTTRFHGPQNGLSPFHNLSFGESVTRRPCLLLNNNQTSTNLIIMSAMCQKETHAPQQNNPLFDHLVGAIGGLIVDSLRAGLAIPRSVAIWICPSLNR